LVLFSNTFQYDFVYWDDDVNVFENENLEELSGRNIARIFNPETGVIIGNYNPLPILTFAIEKHLIGDEPSVHHIINVLFHLICVFLVFRILRLMKISVWGAALGALLFGIHPMRVESVVWITERKDVLMGVFFLSSIFYYIKYLISKRSIRKYFYLSLIIFFIGLFAKIQMVALPLCLLALDYYYRRPLKLKLIWEKIPFFALSLLFGILGIYFLKEYGSLEDKTQFSFGVRLLLGAYSFITYLVKLIFPFKMAPVYPYPNKVLTEYYVAPLLVAGVGYFIWWAFKKKKRPIVFAFAFFIFNIFFVLQILSAGQGYLADRFTYIPYFGFFFLAAYYFDRYRTDLKLSKVLPVVAGILFLLYGYMTFNQNKIWKNSETMWTHVIKANGDTSLPFGNRGNYYRDNKMWDKALADYAQAIKLEPNTSGYYNSRGKLYFDKQEFPRAIEDYNKAISIKDDNPEYFHNRGSALAMSGRVNQAIPDFSKAIEIKPNEISAYEGRSLAYFNTSQYQKAIEDYNVILGRKPNDHGFLYERGMSYLRTGQNERALSDFNKAIRINSAIGSYFYGRASCHKAMNRMAEARSDAQRARQLGYKVEQSFLNSLQ
jgi:tetratricopeptide (TPR) repeat protein